MNATNRLTQPGKKMSFSQIITSDSMQKMIAKSVSDPRAAARFTATLISVVSSSQQLKECEPQSIVAAALRGEGYGLILGHGYGVVPYGSVATFILQYKGMIQLAMSTGFYEDIDCKEVREGEYKGRDRRTGRVTVDFSTYETDEEREQHPTIGYYAYFELKDGYFRAEYMSVDALLKHADHYSPAFSLETYNKFMAGELDEKETAKLMHPAHARDLDVPGRKLEFQPITPPVSADTRHLRLAEGAQVERRCLKEIRGFLQRKL